MAEEIKVLKIDDPDLESKMQELQEQMSAGVPAHVKALGDVIRSDSMASFRRHLRRMGIDHNLSPRKLKLFRDYLTTKRLDLKDLEPAARENLREDTLKKQPEEEMTDDYKRYVKHRENRKYADETLGMSCKSCSWFVRVPEGEKKTCVEQGAKGTDFPCYGFKLFSSRDPNRKKATVTRRNQA